MAPETTSRRGLSLLVQNREGIVSLPGTPPFPNPGFTKLMERAGYLAIYLIGAEVGRVVVPRNAIPREDSDAKMARKLALYAGVSWAMLFIFRQCGVAVSRRLVSPSLPFFFTVLTLTLTPLPMINDRQTRPTYSGQHRSTPLFSSGTSSSSGTPFPAEFQARARSRRCWRRLTRTDSRCFYSYVCA